LSSFAVCRLLFVLVVVVIYQTTVASLCLLLIPGKQTTAKQSTGANNF